MFVSTMEIPKILLNKTEFERCIEVKNSILFVFVWICSVKICCTFKVLNHEVFLHSPTLFYFFVELNYELWQSQISCMKFTEVFIKNKNSTVKRQCTYIWNLRHSLRGAASNTINYYPNNFYL